VERLHWLLEAAELANPGLLQQAAVAVLGEWLTERPGLGELPQCPLAELASPTIAAIPAIDSLVCRPCQATSTAT
jgi:hypothetical protein